MDGAISSRTPILWKISVYGHGGTKEYMIEHVQDDHNRFVSHKSIRNKNIC
ncbi:hypothetical protein [Saccharicrinis sp. GN24d3]|uniref:hypothetical protein n=1 Tax=Saccharicrinis sp. GN24d3 TaxID=3458416 RepID=UPI0040351979